MKISVDAHQTHQAVALLFGLELLDVLAECLGQLPLAAAGLDVLALQPLDVALVEHRRHRLDGLEKSGDGFYVLVAV